MKKKRLGELLCERGFVSASDLGQALQDQSGKVVRLGELILQRGLVRKEDLVAVLSEVAGIAYLDCTTLVVEPAVLNLIPDGFARRYRAIAVELKGASLTVVMAEPQNVKNLDELHFTTGLKIIPRFGFQHEIDAAIDRLYGTKAPAGDEGEAAEDDEEMEFISSSTQQRNIAAMREMQAELQQKSRTTPAVQLVASMIKAAAIKHASDIHIEPQASETIVRFRIDGILRDYTRIPRGLQNTVVSRIKILSDMDIAERRAPQDGRFLVRIAALRIDIRVATLPTQYGEKVVMRLLESTAPMQEFKDLGFPERAAQELQRVLRLPQGMLLVTGPTSSGKSTTLYSSLNVIRRPSVNIVTVEDPVEYDLPGLNQVQVNNEGRNDVCDQPSFDPAAGSGRDYDWGNSRQGNGRHRDEGGANRAPGAVDSAHQRQRLGDHASAGYRPGAVSSSQLADGGDRAAAGSAAVHVPYDSAVGRSVPIADAAGRGGGWRDAKPREGLRAVRYDRVQRQDWHL